MCSHIEEAVHARISQQTEPVTYWGGPAARPRVWSGWAIKQLAAFLNLSILLSTHCTHIVLDGSSLRPQYSIGSDCIVLYRVPRPILIVSPDPCRPPTHGQTGHMAPAFIAPLTFRLLGTCYCRHRGFTISQSKPNINIWWTPGQ